MRKAYNIIAPLALVGAFVGALVWAFQPDAGGAETPAPLLVPTVAARDSDEGPSWPELPDCGDLPDGERWSCVTWDGEGASEGWYLITPEGDASLMPEADVVPRPVVDLDGWQWYSIRPDTLAPEVWENQPEHGRWEE